MEKWCASLSSSFRLGSLYWMATDYNIRLVWENRLGRRPEQIASFLFHSLESRHFYCGHPYSMNKHYPWHEGAIVFRVEHQSDLFRRMNGPLL
jgi:hypothetical protein